MLMVSQLLRVARGQLPAKLLESTASERFGARSTTPQVVVWNVCWHCNMHCPHCYVAAGWRPSPDDLSTEEGLALLDQLAATGIAQVVFSGGEPLLRADLFTLLAHAQSLGLAAHLSSNGALIDREVAERLAAVGVRYVGVSVDGLEAFNDVYRGLGGGFARALEGLKHARAAGLKTGLRLTLSRRNLAELDGVYDLAAALPVDRFYLSHLLYAGRGHRMAGDDLSPAESRAILLRLFERAERDLDAGRGPALVTGGNDSDGPLLVGWIAERHGAQAAERIAALLSARGGNSAGERVLCIDHKGRVHPDQFWPQLTLGEVRHQPLAEILAHPMRAELADRERRLTGRCGACRFLSLCRGSHRERAAARSGDLWSSDPACVMTDAEITPAVHDAPSKETLSCLA